MTIPEMKARFREIMPTLGEFIMEWNSEGDRDRYLPSARYRVIYENAETFDIRSCDRSRSFGRYSWNDIDRFLFDQWNKINGMFADEFLETFAVCNISPETVEELL